MRNIFLFSFVLHSLVSFSQNSLSGSVRHTDNKEAVIGATIFIPELRIGATTDLNGDFRLTKLPQGTFTVQISFVSHKTLIEKLMIEGDIKKEFVMENSATSLEEVIVTGSSTKTLIKESPIPVTALSRIQWLQTSSTNLVDAISKLPGVSSISTGAGLSKPVIRGLSFNRVITMHDGVRQEDNQWGEEHSINLDEYSIDRYEIIRGAGSLMYGSDGLGGVMAIYSPRPIEDGKISGRVLTNYQTNNGLYGVSAQVAGNKNGFHWLLHTSHKNAGNYRNAADGRIYSTNYIEKLNFNGFVGINKSWGFSRLFFLRTTQEYNITNGTRNKQGRFTKAVILPNNTEGEAAVSDKELNSRDLSPYNSQYLLNSKISSNSYFQLGKSNLTVNLSYAQNRRLEYGSVFRPWVPDLYFFLQTYYYDARYTLPEKNNWETTIGTNGMVQTMNNRGNEALYPDYHLFDNGVFIFTKKSFNRLKLSGGVRYDVRKLNINPLYLNAQGTFQTSSQGAVETRFKGADKLYKNISWSVGGVYNITKTFLLRANASRGFRAPAVPELSSNGEHAGTFRYEIGNPNAIPEVAYQGDLGFTYEGKGVYLDMSVFQNSIQNYTFSERVQTASGKDSINGGVPVFRYTQGNARLRGIEATLTLNPTVARWFSFTQTYSSVFADNLAATNNESKYLPFIPSPRWISQLKATRDRYKNRLRNLYLTLGIEYYQRQDRVLFAYNTETPTPAYTLTNLGFGADITANSKKTLFSLYVSATNVFDVIYQNHQSRFKYLDINPTTGRRGIYSMGRNLSVKLVVPLGG